MCFSGKNRPTLSHINFMPRFAILCLITSRQNCIGLLGQGDHRRTMTSLFA